CQQHNSHPHSF
nr:immunoglobulin light chain junction region [Macaca mulatta]